TPMADDAFPCSLPDLKVWTALKEHPALAELSAPRTELSAFMTKEKMTDYHLAQYCEKLSTTTKILIALIVLATSLSSIQVSFLHAGSQPALPTFFLFLSLLLMLLGVVVASISLVASYRDLNTLQQLIDEKKDFDNWIMNWELAGEHAPPTAYLALRMRQWISSARLLVPRRLTPLSIRIAPPLICISIGWICVWFGVVYSAATFLTRYYLLAAALVMLLCLLPLATSICFTARKITRHRVIKRDEEEMIAMQTQQRQSGDATGTIAPTTPNAVELEPAASRYGADIPVQPEPDNLNRIAIGTSAQDGREVPSIAPVEVSKSEISAQPPAAAVFELA
ncbi:hypothetical protein C8F01DRAFT_1097806, partial [Mycena amicta]